MRKQCALGGELTQFNEGGSHSQNPMGGIPLGQDASVEQGETKMNTKDGQFIFSDRIQITPDVASALNLPKSWVGKTMSDYSKKLDNQFKDRNDNLSRTTKQRMLNRGAEIQEAIKAQQQSLVEAQNINSGQAPEDMMNGQVPQGMEEYAESPQMAFGGYKKQMFAGGPVEKVEPTIATSDSQVEATDLANDQFNSKMQNYASTYNQVAPTVANMINNQGNDTQRTQTLQSVNALGSLAGGTVGSAVTGATGLYDMGAEAFGKSNVDTSGVQSLKGASAGKSAGAGALKGAGTGAAIGSIIPGVGTVIGAGVGAIVGGVSGFVGGKKDEKAQGKNNSRYAARINRQFSDQYADGGLIDPPSKNIDIRRKGDELILPPIKELRHSIPRYIPTSDGINIPKIEDSNVAQGTKEYVDWYTHPETLKKFEKNTGFSKQRLGDLTNYGANIPAIQASKSYPLQGENSQAEFQGYDVSPKEQIIYEKGVDKSAITHERVHAGGQDTILGPALKRVLGDPNEQISKNAKRDVKRYMDIPEESYGNFHQFRTKLGLKPGEQIKSVEELKKRVLDTKSDTENFYQTYDDDKIMKAINTIAQTGKSNNKKYAALGGYVNTFQEAQSLRKASQNNAQYAKGGILPLDNQLTPAGLKSFTNPEITSSANILNQTPYDLTLLEKLGINSKTVDETATKVGDKLGSALRYTPLAMDAYQLAKFKKPQSEQLDRLGNRYKPTYTDLATQQNIVNQELNNVTGAIQGSGASQGAIRANLLGAQLNKSKALSQAYSDAEARNAQQDALAQQFNLGVDQTNLQQSNSEKDINARNLGNYETQKSKLLGNIGTTAGEIGKEEKFKKMTKEMFGYDTHGKYVLDAEGNKQYIKETSEKKALGGLLMKKRK